VTALNITRRPVVLAASAGASTLAAILARLEEIKARAPIYGLDADRSGLLVGAVEADFIEGYYRYGPLDPVTYENLPGWTFERASTALARSSQGVLRSFDTDEARITSRGLHIEMQRTNLLRQSSSFADSPWATAGVATIGSNAATGPDGTLTADRVTFSSAAGFLAQDVFDRADTETSSLSVYVKKNTGAAWRASLAYFAGGTLVSVMADFNLDTLAATNCDLLELAGGWVRVSITLQNNGTGNIGAQVAILPTADATIIDLWGAQLEVGGAPSSAIPTGASAVTRAPDDAHLTAPNGPGTLFVEWMAPETFEPSAFPTLVNLSDAAGVLSAVILYQQSGGALAAYRAAGGAAATTLVTANTVASGAIGRAALRFTTNGLDGLCANGGAVATADGVTSPYQTEIATLGYGGGSPGYLNSVIRRVLFLPGVLMSDAELQEMTS
jgi:hypothetical protein